MVGEAGVLRAWLVGVLVDGIARKEIGVPARSRPLLERRVVPVLQGLDFGGAWIDADAPAAGTARGTMHKAKGLEFCAVAIVGCKAGQLPSDLALAGTDDEAGCAALLERVRPLFCVACTRAREALPATSCRSALRPPRRHADTVSDPGFTHPPSR